MIKIFRLALSALRLAVLCTSVCAVLAAQESDAASTVYARASDSVLVLVGESDEGDSIQGTGFVVEGGKVVTNAHVVSGRKVFIDLGVIKVPASIDRIDEFNDLALLTPSMAVQASPLILSDGVPGTGTSIFAIGNPKGLEKTISTGIVSGVRDFEGRRLIQVTSPLSPGSSGGPILDRSGGVVGVAVAIMEEGQNLNFAVPASLALRLIREPLANGASSENEMLASVSAERMRSILKTMDLKFDESTSEDRSTYTIELADQVFWLIRTDQWLLVQDEFSDQVTTEQVNAWNRATTYGRAYITDEGVLRLERDLGFEGGVSEGAIKHLIETFPVLTATLAGALSSSEIGSRAATLRQPHVERFKSKSAKKKVASSSGAFEVWLDPKEWSIANAENTSRILFVHDTGLLFAQLIAEPLPIPRDRLSEIALDNMRKADPKAQITESEIRTVNGQQVLMLKMSATVQDHVFHYMNYYYSGPAGTAQLMTWTSPDFFQANTDKLETFLNGFTVSR